MIFTTNHLEQLDEVLKIHLSYCGGELVEAQLAEVEMMPADITEVFTRCDAEREGTNATMNEVVEKMWQRKMQTIT
ncbi:hypothetical protein ZIOFF_042758 [Zingiber officinale]|uniref:ATPase AAA-type core domain-containing protein n=1 Tax=Zingiber officinale TaxID=94328 RepID=A0A8J5FW61_ZINOF|nr:hypothetical protein ZIOFF_042758 [Zingiber officinale]